VPVDSQADATLYRREGNQQVQQLDLDSGRAYGTAPAWLTSVAGRRPAGRMPLLPKRYPHKFTRDMVAVARTSGLTQIRR
jgi:hypothetical protein